jgi:hypothetical protein
MSLHDLIKEDAKKVFANLNDFAEPAGYKKRNGRTRSIKAVIVREALGVLPEDGDVVYPVFEVHVANDENEGISSDELNLGGDELSFSDRVGQPPRLHSILRLIAHDEGMLILECR